MLSSLANCYWIAVQSLHWLLLHLPLAFRFSTVALKVHTQIQTMTKNKLKPPWTYVIMLQLLCPQNYQLLALSLTWHRNCVAFNRVVASLVFIIWHFPVFRPLHMQFLCNIFSIDFAESSDWQNISLQCEVLALSVTSVFGRWRVSGQLGQEDSYIIQSFGHHRFLGPQLPPEALR